MAHTLRLSRIFTFVISTRKGSNINQVQWWTFTKNHHPDRWVQDGLAHEPSSRNHSMGIFQDCFNVYSSVICIYTLPCIFLYENNLDWLSLDQVSPFDLVSHWLLKYWFYELFRTEMVLKIQQQWWWCSSWCLHLWCLCFDQLIEIDKATENLDHQIIIIITSLHRRMFPHKRTPY